MRTAYTNLREALDHYHPEKPDPTLIVQMKTVKRHTENVETVPDSYPFETWRRCYSFFFPTASYQIHERSLEPKETTYWKTAKSISLNASKFNRYSEKTSISKNSCHELFLIPLSQSKDHM